MLDVLIAYSISTGTYASDVTVTFLYTSLIVTFAGLLTEYAKYLFLSVVLSSCPASQYLQRSFLYLRTSTSRYWRRVGTDPPAQPLVYLNSNSMVYIALDIVVTKCKWISSLSHEQQQSSDGAP